jgi:hypothetical protein
MFAVHLNTRLKRAQMNWEVPVAGQTTLGSGQTKDIAREAGELGKGLPDPFPELQL